MPEDLNAGKIRSWIDKKAKTTNPDLWQWVMNAYKSIPDKDAAPEVSSSNDLEL